MNLIKQTKLLNQGQNNKTSCNTILYSQGIQVNKNSYTFKV